MQDPGFQVLATDGGTHPPEKWAKASSHLVVQISEDISDDRHALADKLREDVERGFVDLFRLAILYAKMKVIRNVFPEHPHDFPDEGLTVVVQSAARTPFANHFSKLEVQEEIKALLKRNFDTVEQLERDWAEKIKNASKYNIKTMRDQDGANRH